MPILTPATLDSHWQYFDNVQTVTLYIRNEDESFGSPQSVQALVPVRGHKQDKVEDEGEIYHVTETISLRASMVTGFPDRGSKIVDSFGNTWYVTDEGSEYKSWNTRIECKVQNG
jgi:hypothetical protein